MVFSSEPFYHGIPANPDIAPDFSGARNLAVSDGLVCGVPVDPQKRRQLIDRENTGKKALG